MKLLRLSISPLPLPTGLFALPLRLIIGFGFMQHGYAKLARGPDDFISVLYAMGLPAPSVLGWATIIVELVGGLMILAGALIPLATVPMAIVLLVAIFTVHLPNGFSSIELQSFDATGAHFGQPGVTAAVGARPHGDSRPAHAIRSDNGVPLRQSQWLVQSLAASSRSGNC